MYILRKIFIVLIAVYYFLNIFLHEFVSIVYGSIFNSYGRTFMEDFLNQSTVMLYALLLMFLVIFLRKKFSWPHFVGLLLISVLLVLSNELLIVTNIERIHFLQYAILSFVILFVVDNDDFALVLCLLLGFFDEFMQYITYPQYTKYLDFNDVVLNLVASFLGIILFRFGKFKAGFYKGAGAIKVTASSTVFILFCLVYSNFFTLYSRNAEDVISAKHPFKFVLSFIAEGKFWIMTNYGRQYHVLTPNEALLLIAFLMLVQLYYLNWLRYKEL